MLRKKYLHVQKLNQIICGIAVILIVFIAESKTFGQNLVPNPGFEDKKGKKYTLKPWSKINTADFYVNSEKLKVKEVNIYYKDRNYLLRKPHSGVAYIGLRVWPKYHEFLQVNLPQTLEAGRHYYFEMYITPSNHCNSFLKSMGASFYDKKPPYNTKVGIRDFPPQIENFRADGLRDTSEWYRISGVFKASGGESVLTIGNFATSNREKFKQKKFSFAKKEAYYYIDDVALYPLDSMGNILYQTPQNQQDINTNTSDTSSNQALNENSDSTNITLFTFEDFKKDNAIEVYFEENSSKLENEDYSKLSFIVEFLLENSKKTVTIKGYAATGETLGEMKISEKRANAVMIVLTGNKVSKSRISISAVGANCEYSKKEDSKRKFCRKVQVIVN